MNEWDEYLQILDEVEEYQKWAKKQNEEFKDDMLFSGPTDNTSPYTEPLTLCLVRATGRGGR